MSSWTTASRDELSTHSGEMITILGMEIDSRGRMFVKREAREVLSLFPNSQVIIEKDISSGRLRLKIQKQKTNKVLKIWYLVEGVNYT